MRTMKLAASALAFICLTAGFVSCSENEFDTGMNNGGNKKEEEGKQRNMFDSDFFTMVTDKSTDVVSYLFKNETTGYDNTQSNYFNAPAMTDDERFLFFFTSPNEYKNMTDGKHNTTTNGAVFDFKLGKIYKFEGVGRDCYPYLDPKEDVIYYCIRNSSKSQAYFAKRNLLEDPTKEIKLASFPQELVPTDRSRPLQRACSHITLTQDKKKVLIDCYLRGATSDHFYQGLLDLYTGEWDEWGHTTDHQLTHGQINPSDNTVALYAMDDSYTDYAGVKKSMVNDPPKDGFPDGVYPRIQIVKKGSRYTMDPDPERNYATHEKWSEDGKYVYWCSNGVCIRNLKTGQYEKIYSDTKAAHAFLSADMKYITFDDNSDFSHYGTAYYRGCRWRVGFYNRDTGKLLWIHSQLPQIAEKTDESQIHPDPHPHFVCNNKYVVCTAATSDGNIHVSITPVKQLLEKTK